MSIISNLKYQNLKFQATFMVGMLSVGWANDAWAQTSGGDVTFGTIARNINNSIAELPGLLSGVSYLLGLLLGVLGILKVKDHVENPTQTPMKEGAIRIVAGGALFGLPIIYESMLNTIGTTGTLIETPKVNKADFGVQ